MEQIRHVLPVASLPALPVACLTVEQPPRDVLKATVLALGGLFPVWMWSELKKLRLPGSLGFVHFSPLATLLLFDLDLGQVRLIKLAVLM